MRGSCLVVLLLAVAATADLFSDVLDEAKNIGDKVVPRLQEHARQGYLPNGRAQPVLRKTPELGERTNQVARRIDEIERRITHDRTWSKIPDRTKELGERKSPQILRRTQDLGDQRGGGWSQSRKGPWSKGGKQPQILERTKEMGEDMSWSKGGKQPPQSEENTWAKPSSPNKGGPSKGEKQPPQSKGKPWSKPTKPTKTKPTKPEPTMTKLEMFVSTDDDCNFSGTNARVNFWFTDGSYSKGHYKFYDSEVLGPFQVIGSQDDNLESGQETKLDPVVVAENRDINLKALKTMIIKMDRPHSLLNRMHDEWKPQMVVATWTSTKGSSSSVHEKSFPFPKTCDYGWINSYDFYALSEEGQLFHFKDSKDKSIGDILSGGVPATGV
ncbi:hypothetical protein L596_025389 [Steinernema carpocapsae]|uniref:Uncharacterized protein n=1 Tax=Steinernema carpocapsae TaxID=34508 RepID=A0A4V5ZYU3_STECR|nr:hypothetical protein L596_025389 [Steinernema carpocapsae]